MSTILLIETFRAEKSKRNNGSSFFGFKFWVRMVIIIQSKNIFQNKPILNTLMCLFATIKFSKDFGSGNLLYICCLYLQIICDLLILITMGAPQQIDPRIANKPIDFTKKHPIFNIELEKQGPEFSEIDEQRKQYIRKFAGKVEVPEPFVPQNIAGLVPKTGPLPFRRRIWRRPSSSFERNGWLNIHTHNFNTRLVYPLFFGFLLYGWWGHATSGLHHQRYYDNGELSGNLYDKLNSRVPPLSKLWLRPG